MIRDLVAFVRVRGLGVVATTGTDGEPEAALVGLAASDDGELIFDTSTTSRKYLNLLGRPRAAVVVGWDDEVTLQVEGSADLPEGAERARCQEVYFEQYPDGRDRASSPEIGYVRIRPRWWRYSDFRPDSFCSEVTELSLGGGADRLGDQGG
ncbi:MAG: segregation and condensation protein [Nocardioidaceae bacterium]|nr:segregation and condensation protein [Nocardioidaceae bacterium]